MSNASRVEANPADTQQSVWHRRMRRLRIWLSISCLALVASTWKLWTPQTVFPQIPFLAALRTAPAWLDWLGLALMLVALVAMLVLALIDRSRPAPAGRDGDLSPLSTRLSAAPSPAGEGLRMKLTSLVFVTNLTLLVLLDQLRFQPWAYQFGIVAIVLAFAPAGNAASLLRVLTVSIYFWSAVSKFDYTFLHGLGPELLRGLLAAFHLEPGWMRPEAATTLAWAFPLDELAVAVLLAIRRTRTIGLVAAIAMHVLLLETLGPFGLNHSPGVLLWNVYFMGQDLLLFRRPAAGWKESAGPGAKQRFRDSLEGLAIPIRRARFAHSVVFLAVWLPILHVFGWLDAWPAWAVYAPASERIVLLISDEDALARGFDKWSSTAPFDTARFGSWHWYLADDYWSFDTVKTPLYPESRFRTGVALAAMKRYQLGDAAVLVVESRANRWTGKRTRTTYSGGDAIREYAETFNLNALPRKLGGW
jgi:hypothetical protein